MSKQRSINYDIIRQFWRFTQPNKRTFFASVFGSGLAIIVQNILPPFVISRAFNRLQYLYITHQSLNFRMFLPYLLLYFGLIFAGFLIWRIQVICAWLFEIHSMRRIMEYIFNHLQNQSSHFHANRFGGSLVSQANKFVGAYERFMDDLTWSITTSITTFIASVTVLFFVSPFYAVALMLLSTTYFLIMFKRMKIQMPLDRALASSESDRTARLADNITNVATVRAFAGEEHEAELFHEQATTTANKNFALMWMVARNDFVAHFGVMSMNLAAFSLGVLVITNFKAPVGVLYLALTYTFAITQNLWEARRTMRNLNRAFGDASDMAEILKIEPDVRDIDNPEVLKVSEGQIEFEEVDFKYKDAKSSNVFDDLSFTIDGGEKVGLVGPSGGGKTTITSLLQRFVDIQKGAIKIDGQDITHVAQADLRNHIAYVPQDPLMFHRTIADNIRYGKPGAGQAEIEAVAKLAHAHEFIQKLPDGYTTLVGERGIKLSGGQRQRVAIARAMLKDAPILVLDEATSALDSESEKLIQDALWKLMEGRTTLVIAHRLSTIQHMDRIIVLDNGKIVEQGNHKGLLKRKGLYAKLWAHQSGGFLEE